LLPASGSYPFPTYFSLFPGKYLPPHPALGFAFFRAFHLHVLHLFDKMIQKRLLFKTPDGVPQREAGSFGTNMWWGF
jgi:hypothetical protein